jgi:uncharacterized protein
MTAMPRRVWVLMGDKPGDNAQCLALAGALGWPFEEKQLHYHALGRSILLPFGEPRFALDRSRSSALEPPWPDLVIGCGRRSVPVVREIRRRAGAGTRLVQFGRPRADLEGFDLVVTSAQYALPDRPNVMHLVLPLHVVDQAARSRAGAEWAPRFAALPRPWIGLLVGGTAKPFKLDPPSARRLAREASALAGAAGGSLLVSTSRRTTEASARAIEEGIEVPSHVHRWTPGGGPNPYAAYLALADAFVVTGDSASMLADACSTGRRVWFVDLPTDRPSLRQNVRNFVRRTTFRLADYGAAAPGSLARATSRFLARGWVRHPRDLRRLHGALAASNRALPLGVVFDAPPPAPGDDVERVAERVRSLFEGPPRRTGPAEPRSGSG